MQNKRIDDVKLIVEELISAVETSGTINLRTHGEFGDDGVESCLKERATITHPVDDDTHICAEERANIFYYEDKIANTCAAEAAVIENTSQNDQPVTISPRQSVKEAPSDSAQDVLPKADQSVPISTTGKLDTT